MARRINLLHGANSKLWPARIPVSKAWQYIGMARQTWYNTYRKEWQVEKLAEGTNSLSRDTVKMLQDRWIGAATALKGQQDNSGQWKYLYMKDQFEQALRMQFEVFLAQTLPSMLASALAACEQEVPFDDCLKYIEMANKNLTRMGKRLPPAPEEDRIQNPDETIKAIREHNHNYMNNPDPEPDHPDQTYLQDQLEDPLPDEDIPDALKNLVANWETTDEA